MMRSRSQRASVRGDCDVMMRSRSQRASVRGDCDVMMRSRSQRASNAACVLVAARHASASTNLKDILSDLVPKEQTRIKKFKEQHGKTTIGQITVDMPPLVQAIFKRDAEEVRVLLHKKEDVNALDQERRTPLHAAAFLGDVQIMELLINSGASVNAKDHVWFTPLHRAAASRNEKAVALLLKKSAEVSARDKFWQTPLHVAAANRATKCAEAVIPLLSSVNVADRTGRTALHHAAHSGHIEAVMGCEDCVCALLDHDAFALCRDFKGRTPLHLAAACGHVNLLGTLLQAAFNTDPLDSLLDYSGYTPAHWAACHGHEDCLEVLLEHKPFSIEEGNPFTPLHCAVTPLHAAAFSENLPSLQLLLSHGAEVNAVDQAGRSAIMVAADCGQTAIVDILLSRAKADLTLLDENKNTALHLACSKGHEMCALLILRETHEAALINATNTALQMPLHIAARNGLATVVQVLLSQGATVLAVDEEALACAPNKDVADCLALILSTMKPFPPKDAMGSPFGLNLLKNCGIAAACSPLQPNGSLRQRSYGKERRHGAIGLDGCFTD
ncbi:UNVERIFIED_CONTAM: hypothetical protein FKN15_077973 [Acipenser sinensis]